MRIIKTINDFNAYRCSLKQQDVGFVATMGALHEGHLSLVNRSIQENTHTIASIYINPTQFDNNNDLSNYPNTLENDLYKLENSGVDAVFIPSYSEIYPDNYTFQILENNLSQRYCGAHRPGHFNGVLTVVMKLFHIIKPQKAYFGEKDYQQLSLIKNMVNAFFLDVEVIGCPTIREADGLAMSSRNLRLNQQQRKMAVQLYHCISSDLTIKQMGNKLIKLGFTVDYVEKLHNRLLAAVYIDDIRLIDNVEISPTKENKT